MVWFKVDDSFYVHPKVFDAPDCAVALWVRAGCWSAQNRSDGFVPASMPARLCDDHDTAVRELLRRGLWMRTKDGFRFHDWLDYQPSAAEQAEKREKRAEAGRLGGLAKAAKQNASNGLANASQDAKQKPAPTRPDPTRKTKTSRPAPPSDDDPDFAAFWAAYPVKKDKGQARKGWPKAIQLARPEEIVAAAKRYAQRRQGEDPKFTPYPATWLSGERWRDEESIRVPSSQPLPFWEA